MRIAWRLQKGILSKIIYGLLVAWALLVPGVWADVNVYLDIEEPGADTAIGYSSLDQYSCYHVGAEIDLGNGLTAGWVDTVFVMPIERLYFSDWLTRDFMEWDEHDNSEVLEIRGLAPGNYDLTIYATDLAYLDKHTRFEIDVDHDDTTDHLVLINNKSGENQKSLNLQVGAAGILSLRIRGEDYTRGAFNGLDLVASGGADQTPPEAITDLTVVETADTSVFLTWTAPADDQGAGGAVDLYDLRYAFAPIDAGNWENAYSCLNEPIPGVPGQTEQFEVSTLSPETEYYFALLSLDESNNTSALSNGVQATTSGGGEPPDPGPQQPISYGYSNGFSLELDPAGSYAPSSDSTGKIQIKQVQVDQNQISRLLARSGPVYVGTLTYNLVSEYQNLFAWLELSTDGGVNWKERRIHAVGKVGRVQPGTGLTVQWLVDGDQGDECRIRVRVRDNPDTYTSLDADDNKYPRPAPNSRYPNIERLLSERDGFDFSHPDAVLPHVDFYKSVAPLGMIQAGFARTRFFHPGDEYKDNPINFLHCMYLESEDGLHRYVILQGDVQKLWTDTIHRWRDQIEQAFGIPEDHIMVFFTHVHNYMSEFDGVETFPLELIEEAMAAAGPVQIAFLNREMGPTFNIHRAVMTDADHAYTSFGNGIYANPQSPALPVVIDYDAQGEILDAKVDATEVSDAQTFFDGPTDSRLQMMVFRDPIHHALKGIFLKWTGHPVNRDYTGDLPRCVMDTLQNRFGEQVEVMYTSGFAGNQRQLFAQEYPDHLGSERTAEAFADLLEESLPELSFFPLVRMGMVMGYDTFGAREDHEGMRGIDPERYGVGVQVFRFNDIYLSTLPGEAPVEQGLYIRARSNGIKHIYNAFGNTWYNYYTWGRWFDITHYGKSTEPTRYESFRMAQEVIRGTGILEDAYPWYTLKFFIWDGESKGPLAEDGNTVFWIVFPSRVVLPENPPLLIHAHSGGDNLAEHFVYEVLADECTLQVTAPKDLLDSSEGYRIEKAECFTVSPFCLDFYPGAGLQTENIDF